MQPIPILAYDPVIEHGAIVYDAVVDEKRRIRMPSAFKPMYTADYLAVQQVHCEMPEVFGLTEPDFYIPVRTADD